MSETLIHPDKVRAYLATDYRIGHTDLAIVLNVGQRSDRLADLFVTHGVTCGAFITAYNPQGAQQNDEANDKAHADLGARLQQMGIEAIEGSGSEADSEWPAERSYFALGLSLHATKSIGSHFGQDAVGWVGSDAIPQLILLR
jgi:hypothetical protein